MRGEPVATVRQYRVGVTYRRVEGDLYAARHGDLRRVLSLAPRPRTGGMWDARDPVPSLLLGGGIVAAAIRKRTG
ncbi:MAG: hypothetical protein ICV64_09730 [Thermoleophilia bacterium]|nr:hypothetical protein [Thermoleophilia bacterium]